MGIRLAQDKGNSNGDRDDNDDGISCFIQTEAIEN